MDKSMDYKNNIIDNEIEDNENTQGSEILEERKDKIVGFVNDDAYKPMRVSDILMFLQVPTKDRDLFYQLINELIQEGRLVLTKKEKVMTPEKLNMILGTFISNAKGFGFVVPDKEMDSDIFIPASMTNGAMHKDKVWCVINNQNGRRPEGEIVKILERGMKQIVGTFEESKGFGFVVPDDKKMAQDIFISKENTHGAVTGHKVVVKITKPPTDRRSPEGRVVEILGHINDPGVDIISIIRQYELPVDFDDKIYSQIEKIENEVDPAEFEGRKDLRDEIMVTIDGEDAKDLDDAVCVKKLENGNYRLGVHIADVSNYVTENSPLDKEALKRGTSVYLVDRVIPMLPHKLSNGICSLNEGVDRLAMSCIMEIDQSGKVVNHEICESVIKVTRRMSYTVVYDLLTNENSEYKEEYKDLIPMFKEMEELRDILLKKRIKRGAIEFDFPEAKIILDENGKPIDIKPYERNVATSIIEEFMLAANETVAEEYYWLELPFIFRTHEEPDEEKIDKLSEFIGKLGYVLKGSATHPKVLQKILEKSHNTPEDMVINKVVLRSLKQARYTADNEGHFGLAAKYYCHFTSPIRRYPDLQIHRIIKANLRGLLSPKKISALSKKMPDVAKQCSLRERVADEAERETDDLKKVEFMKDKVGEIFDGIISGVMSWGIFVELPNTIEGLVAARNLEDDYYIFEEENMRFIGERTHKTYTIGDKVKVKLVRANMEEKNLDFEFVEDEENQEE